MYRTYLSNRVPEVGTSVRTCTDEQLQSNCHLKAIDWIDRLHEYT